MFKATVKISREKPLMNVVEAENLGEVPTQVLLIGGGGIESD